MITLALTAPLENISARLSPLRQQLAAHPLYRRIQTVEDVRLFMQSHVFAVWDFMSLLKALQSRLTCVTVPWSPTSWPASRRFINEIVLGEESDLYQGRAISHFELYVEAMRDAGANTAPIEELVSRLTHSSTASSDFTLDSPSVPTEARKFVESTFGLVREAQLHSIAAAFTFGREDIIPDIFRSLIRDLNKAHDNRFAKFIWYLERHIEVDGEDHGPLSLRMVADLCGTDEALWEEASVAAESALKARIALWDGISSSLQG